MGIFGAARGAFGGAFSGRVRNNTTAPSGVMGGVISRVRAQQAAASNQSQASPQLPPGIGNAYGVGAQTGFQRQSSRNLAEDSAAIGIGSMAGSARAMQGPIDPAMAMASNQMQQGPVDTITALASNQMQPTPINPAAFSNTAAIENMYGAQVPNTFTRSVGDVNSITTQPQQPIVPEAGQEFINDYNT
jgi:hypothetical protein